MKPLQTRQETRQLEQPEHWLHPQGGGKHFIINRKAILCMWRHLYFGHFSCWIIYFVHVLLDCNLFESVMVFEYQLIIQSLVTTVKSSMDTTGKEKAQESRCSHWEWRTFVELDIVAQWLALKPLFQSADCKRAVLSTLLPYGRKEIGLKRKCGFHDSQLEWIRSISSWRIWQRKVDLISLQIISPTIQCERQL